MFTINYILVNSAVPTIKVWLGNVTITSSMDLILGLFRVHNTNNNVRPKPHCSRIQSTGNILFIHSKSIASYRIIWQHESDFGMTSQLDY